MAPKWGENEKPSLAASTWTNYEVRLKMLCKETGKGIDESIIDAEGSYKALRESTMSVGTRKSIVTAVASFLSNSPKLSEQHKK